jgi:hypothetical protein
VRNYHVIKDIVLNKLFGIGVRSLFSIIFYQSSFHHSHTSFIPCLTQSINLLSPSILKQKLFYYTFFFFFLPLFHRWGQYNMFSSCCVKDLAFAWRQSSLKLEWVPTIANAAGTTEELETINFGHPSDDWPLQKLLSFRYRTPSALTARPSSFITR